MMDIADQVLNDLTTKLRLNTFDNYDYNNISDEDIVMKDYSDDEMEEYSNNRICNTKTGFNENDINLKQRNNHLKENAKSEQPNNLNSTENEEVKISSETPYHESKSLIRTFFKPELQGYMYGINRNHKEDFDADDDKNEGNLYEFFESNNINKADNNISSTEILYKKLHDRNLIIHNHFYNIIASNNNEKSEDNNYLSDHPDFEENLDFYDQNENYNIRIFENIKIIINYSIIVSFSLFLILRIIKDIGIEYNKLVIREKFEQDQCMNEYYTNKCDEYGQLPALKRECLEWKICFSSGNSIHLKRIFYSELFVQVIGRLVNEMLNNIGGKNKVVLIIIIFIWYFGNFLCGYVRSQHVNSNEKRKKFTKEIDNKDSEKIYNNNMKLIKG